MFIDYFTLLSIFALFYINLFLSLIYIYIYIYIYKAAGITKKSECVHVVLRCRPMNKKELQAGYKQAVDIDTKSGSVSIIDHGSGGKEEPKRFTFDSCYDVHSSQKDIYDRTAAPIVNSVMEGYNGK